jgi:hypothetical protein
MVEILRLPHIERKPKEVEFLETYRDTIGLSKRPELLTALETIIDCIESGRALPLGSYRGSTVLDELLEDEGYMHLHLGDPTTRELIFLVQYPHHVVILEITDHYHFKTRPRGAVLKRIHGKALVKSAAARQQKRLLRAAAIRAGFKPRKK